MHKTKNTESIKPGWRRVKFGDVVRLSKARCADPLAEGVERFVGLEHLEPGDLRIRDWGKVADGVTFTSVFQPGQVLFGKRRAYQRKVAVADFSGVCSGDIYVMETKDAMVLLPELLPFICQTDAFFDHAVGTSAGSLSPRTNWTSLADFQFALPPIAEQRRMLELLESVELLKASYRSAYRLCETAYLSAIEDLLAKAGKPDSTLGEVGVVTDCRHRTPRLVESGTPMVAPGDIKWGKLNLQCCKQMDAEEYETMKVGAQISLGDIVLSRNQSVGIASYVASGDRFVLGQDTVLIQARTLGVEFLYLSLRSQLVQRQIARLAMGSTFKRINLGDIRNLRLPFATPDLEAQARVLMHQHEEALEVFEARTRHVETLRRTALNDVVGLHRDEEYV